MKKNSDRRQLFTIALPILLNMLISQVQLLIDRVFLGRLKVEYMTALGNVLAPFWMTLSMVFALTTGATILISQAIGSKDSLTAYETAHSVIKYNGILSLLLFAFWISAGPLVFTLMGVDESIKPYCIQYVGLLVPVVLATGLNASCASILQASGYTKPLLLAGAIRSGLNLLLDWLLIFGNFGFPEMGIRGAALATSIAEIIGTLILAILVLKSKRIFTAISLKAIFKAKWRAYSKAIKLGSKTAMEEGLWNMGNLGLMRLLNVIDPNAAGLYTIIFSVEIIPALLFMALGQASLTLSGQHTGAAEPDKAVKVGKYALFYCWIFAAVFTAVFVIFPKPILGIFTTDVTIVNSSVILLAIAAANLIPRSANIIFVFTIRGYGDTLWPLKTQIFGTVFVIGLASILILGAGAGIIAVFITVFSDEAIRCIINYRRFRKGPDTAQMTARKAEQTIA